MKSERSRQSPNCDKGEGLSKCGYFVRVRQWTQFCGGRKEKKKKRCRKAGRISDIYWTLWLQLYWQTSGFVCRWGHYFVLTYSTWQIHSLPLLYLKLPLLFLWQKWENKAFYLQGLTGKRLVNSRQRIITVMIFPIFLSYF